MQSTPVSYLARFQESNWQPIMGPASSETTKLEQFLRQLPWEHSLEAQDADELPGIRLNHNESGGGLRILVEGEPGDYEFRIVWEKRPAVAGWWPFGKRSQSRGGLMESEVVRAMSLFLGGEFKRLERLF